MKPDDFTVDELTVLYAIVHNHIAENIDMLDSGDYGEYTRNDLIADNIFCNSLKKITKHLKLLGADPDKIFKKGC